jgi:N-methylhydantoinase A
LAHAVGIDVGGTFTDFVAVDSSGHSLVAKVPSTPEDQAIAVMTGLGQIGAELGLDLGGFLGSCDVIVHGTTVGTNLMLEENGAVTGMITTRGHRDVIDVRRNIKEAAFDIHLPPPFPLVPRRRRIGVTERVDSQGNVIVPLDDDDVRRAVRDLVEQGVQSVAVCFLFSFLNPAHELRAAEIVRELAPELHVSLSHEVLPRIKEFERFSTTIVDAFITPGLRRYLASLRDRLADAGFSGDLFVMTTTGGMVSVGQASRHGVQLVLSGPAGGVIASREIGRRAGTGDVITIDMGGTSFDTCLIAAGEPAVSTESWINRYKVAIPSLDVHTIGAGGGSIAWVDEGGRVRVGPESAGAVPGPACYGRGGERPTVTDADVVLGRIGTESFLGGTMPLDAAAAERAVARHVAESAGLDVVVAADGIVRVVVNNMANGIREVSQKRGIDPRDYALVAFGGAGPLHAVELARELGIGRILVPRDRAPVLSALGDVLSDVRVSKSAGFYTRSQALDLDGLNDAIAATSAAALAELAEVSGLESVRTDVTFEMHYKLQTHDLLVAAALDGKELLTAETAADTFRRFHDLHERLYTFQKPEHEIEILSVQVDAFGVRPKTSLTESGAPAGGAHPGAREVFFSSVGGFVETPVYDGRSLATGAEIAGPAIVEEANTSVAVDPGATLRLATELAYEVLVA